MKILTKTQLLKIRKIREEKFRKAEKDLLEILNKKFLGVSFKVKICFPFQKENDTEEEILNKITTSGQGFFVKWNKKIENCDILYKIIDNYHNKISNDLAIQII